MWVAMSAGAALLLMTVALVLLVATGSGQPPAATRQPPTYPGATPPEEVQLTAEDERAGIYRSVAFTTPDAPEVVLAFYKDALQKEGWQVDPFQPEPHNALTLRWTSYEQPPVIYLVVVSARLTENATAVRLDMRYNPGER